MRGSKLAQHVLYGFVGRREGQRGQLVGGLRAVSSQQVMREAGRQAQHLHVVSVQGRAPPLPAGGGGGAARAPRPLGWAGLAGFELQAPWFAAADLI